MGSQLSLASTTAYGSLNEKYEHAIRDMARDLECYKNTVDSLTKKQENYGALFDLFEQKLRKLTQHIDRSNLKPEEAIRFRQDIAHLRDISNHLASNSAHANVCLNFKTLKKRLAQVFFRKALVSFFVNHLWNQLHPIDHRCHRRRKAASRRRSA